MLLLPPLHPVFHPLMYLYLLSCNTSSSLNCLKDSQRLLKLRLSIFGDSVSVQSLRIGLKYICQTLNLWEGKCASVQRGRERVRELIGETFPKNLSKYFPKLKIVETKLMTFYFVRLAFGELQRFSLVLISRSGLLWNNSRPLRQVEIASNCEKNILSRSNILQSSSYCLNFIWNI